jgi:hypothetical protein
MKTEPVTHDRAAKEGEGLTFEMQTWKHVQRLTDLVRHQRSELHEAGLISDYEYERLAEDHGAVKRLEDYEGAIRAARLAATQPPQEFVRLVEGRSALEQTESRVELANSVMKLPYIKATRNTETGQERFVARDDVVTCIHEYAKRAREGKV